MSDLAHKVLRPSPQRSQTLPGDPTETEISRLRPAGFTRKDGFVPWQTSPITFLDHARRTFIINEKGLLERILIKVGTKIAIGQILTNWGAWEMG